MDFIIAIKKYSKKWLAQPYLSWNADNNDFIPLKFTIFPPFALRFLVMVGSKTPFTLISNNSDFYILVGVVLFSFPLLIGYRLFMCSQERNGDGNR